MKLRPLGNRLIVEPKEIVKKTSGGLYLPDQATETPQEGIIIVLGTEVNSKFKLKIGDHVLFSKYGGTEVKIDDKIMKIFGEDDIVAVIE